MASTAHSGFPLHGVECPRRRMFRAAFTSRSWTAPQFWHVHSLIANPLDPVGPERTSQYEQVTEVYASFTI